MQRQPISIRPTPEQRQWMDEQAKRRGLPRNAVVLLALEQAMNAEPFNDHEQPHPLS